MKITEEEAEILLNAKSANLHWFNAMLYCAEIMSSRRQKYAGDFHPYYNFVDMAYRLGENVVNIFRFYLNIKVSRIGASETDFPDESVKDSYADAANYALIACGWMLDELTPYDVIDPGDWLDEQHLQQQSIEQSDTFWRSLIRINSIDDTKESCYVVVPGWNPFKTIRLWFAGLPENIVSKVLSGQDRFHARINIGVENYEDLIFIDWELE